MTRRSSVITPRLPWWSMGAILLLFTILLLAACAQSITTPTPTPTLPGLGTVEGALRIGPLCPVEPCPFEPPNPYLGKRVVLTPTSGQSTDVAVSSDGTFMARVPAGEYELTVVECPYLGCSSALPRRVAVGTGRVTTIEVRIDTGIR